MGTIKISNLQLNAVIGTLEHERTHRQKLILTVEFDYDSARAAENDDLFASVDYSAVEREVALLVENSSFFLVEALAKAAAEKVLAFAGVSQVRITIDKPAASALGAMISYSETFCNVQML